MSSISRLKDDRGNPPHQGMATCLGLAYSRPKDDEDNVGQEIDDDTDGEDVKAQPCFKDICSIVFSTTGVVNVVLSIQLSSSSDFDNSICDFTPT